MAKKRSSEDLDKQVIFETPIANLKGERLELIKQQYDRCGTAVLQYNSNPDAAHSSAAHSSFLLLLNMIPGGKGGKIRHRIYDKYLALHEKRLSEAESKTKERLTHAEKLRILIEVDIEMAGLITDNIDMYIGLQGDIH